MRRPHLPIPDAYRFLNIDGVDYFLPWEELHPGCSFFLKTVATPAQVRAALKPAEQFLRMTLVVSARVEFGRYGVRVWRT